MTPIKCIDMNSTDAPTIFNGYVRNKRSMWHTFLFYRVRFPVSDWNWNILQKNRLLILVKSTKKILYCTILKQTELKFATFVNKFLLSYKNVLPLFIIIFISIHKNVHYYVIFQYIELSNFTVQLGGILDNVTI